MKNTMCLVESFKVESLKFKVDSLYELIYRKVVKGKQFFSLKFNV